MDLTLQSPQCFAIAIIVFGVFGFLQGWRIALVLMGFTLAAVLFLIIGGASGFAEIFFVRLPQTINVLSGGAIGPKSPSPPSANQVLISALIALGVAMLLGIVIGNRAFPAKPGSVSTKDHFLGVIPGLVTGYALISYASRIFASSQTISVGVNTPNPSTLGNYIVVLVVVAVIALVVGLLTARFGK
jgi:hypothetical protein